jgi:hypothetical protein
VGNPYLLGRKEFRISLSLLVGGLTDVLTGILESHAHNARPGSFRVRCPLEYSDQSETQDTRRKEFWKEMLLCLLLHIFQNVL